MAITSSAKKAIRVSKRKKLVNDRRTKTMKDTIKKFEKAVKADKTTAVKMLPGAYAVIDKAAKRGVIKKNNASRKKARLTRLVK